jgi:hypothetical protein
MAQHAKRCGDDAVAEKLTLQVKRLEADAGLR